MALDQDKRRVQHIHCNAEEVPRSWKMVYHAHFYPQNILDLEYTTGYANHDKALPLCLYPSVVVYHLNH
ncbi:hypothetical protein MA16_Dca007346 [Dendrobium catenatum]|uniref:Uncharacterized protein n=1 Tax=Dendrobium catenatum TaxID=906689 RepID=A0A2I0W8K8_9ASPA|nr:hypothetical protein MA16_Dca007346 [Dendrobium catenatum]